MLRFSDEKLGLTVAASPSLAREVLSVFSHLRKHRLDHLSEISDFLL